MILITRLNGSKIYLNVDLIKSVEPTPDTVVTLTNGEKFVAKEPAQVIVERIIEYNHLIHTTPTLNQAGD